MSIKESFVQPKANHPCLHLILHRLLQLYTQLTPFIFVSITANTQCWTTLTQILLLNTSYQSFAESSLRLYCLFWKSLMDWYLLTPLIYSVFTPTLKSLPSGFSVVLSKGLSLTSVILSLYLRVYLYVVYTGCPQKAWWCSGVYCPSRSRIQSKSIIVEPKQNSSEFSS